MITGLTYPRPADVIPPLPVKESASTRCSDASDKQSGVFQNVPVEVTTEPTDEPFPDPAEFPLPLKESASTMSGNTSDKQSGVVQNAPVEVTTEPTDEPFPDPAVFLHLLLRENLPR